MILWQGDVLSVAHREPRGSVFLEGRSSCADISLPDELLDGESSCIAVCTRGEVSAVLPVNARGWRTLPDGQRCPLPSLPEPSPPTAQLLPLPLGNRVHLSLALLVVGTLGVRSRMAPPRGLTPDEQSSSERLYTLQTYLAAAAARAKEGESAGVAEAPPISAAARRRAPPPRSEAPPDTGEREQPFEDPDALPSADAAAAGSVDSRERRDQLTEARSIGIIGLLGEAMKTLSEPKAAVSARAQQLRGGGDAAPLQPYPLHRDA